MVLWKALGYTFHSKKPIVKVLRTPEMVHPSILAFSESEPLFQRNFCSNGYISTKSGQKRLFNGSLESAWIYLSFKKPIVKVSRSPELVRPSIFAFSKFEPLFQRKLDGNAWIGHVMYSAKIVL